MLDKVSPQIPLLHFINSNKLERMQCLKETKRTYKMQPSFSPHNSLTNFAIPSQVGVPNYFSKPRSVPPSSVPPPSFPISLGKVVIGAPRRISDLKKDVQSRDANNTIVQLKNATKTDVTFETPQLLGWVLCRPEQKIIFKNLVYEFAIKNNITFKENETPEALMASILSDKNKSYSALPDWVKAYTARSSGEAEFKKLIYDHTVPNERDWTDDDYRIFFKEKTGLTVEQLNELIISTDFFMPHCFPIYESKDKDHLGYKNGLFEVCSGFFRKSLDVLIPTGKQEIKTILDNNNAYDSFACDSNMQCIGTGRPFYHDIKKLALQLNINHLLDVAIESGYELTEDDFDTIFTNLFDTNFYAWEKLKEKFTPERAMKKLKECIDGQRNPQECRSAREIYLFEENRKTQQKFRISEEDRQRIEQNIIKQMKEITDLKDKQNKLVEQQLRTEQKNLSDDQFRTKVEFVFLFAFFGVALGCCSREFYRKFTSFREQFNAYVEHSKQIERRYERLLQDIPDTPADFSYGIEMEGVSPTSFGRGS